MPPRPIILLRRATPSDEAALLEQKHALRVGARQVGVGDAAWAAMMVAALRDTQGPFCFGNHVLALVGGEVAGSACLNGFAQIERRTGPQIEATSLAFAERLSAEDELLSRAAPPSLFVSEMVVARRFRRRGVASALLAFAEEAALGHGLPNVSLMVDAANHPALALYRKWGFVSRASRPHRLPNERTPLARRITSGLPLILLVRTLVAQPALGADSAFLKDNPATSCH